MSRTKVDVVDEKIRTSAPRKWPVLRVEASVQDFEGTWVVLDVGNGQDGDGAAISRANAERLRDALAGANPTDASVAAVDIMDMETPVVVKVVGAGNRDVVVLIDARDATSDGLAVHATVSRVALVASLVAALDYFVEVEKAA